MAYSDVDEDLRSSQGAFIARMDCEENNRKFKETYSDNQILEAHIFKDMVNNAFFRRRVFLNYREKFITVKVEAPKLADKISSEYQDVIKFAEDSNYKIKSGRASLIFEIARK